MNLSQVVDSLWKSSRRTLVALALAASYAVPALPSASCNSSTSDLDCVEGDSFTTESGVRIVWGDDPEMFLEEMAAPPVNAYATSLCRQEYADRSIAAVLNGLAKYPDSILASNLEAVYLVSRLEIYDTVVGGTVDKSAQRVYIAGASSSCWMERMFHHEFSSILRYRHPWNISQWVSENPKDFTYGNDAIAAIQHQVSGELDPQLAEDGFLTEYSTTSLENDFGTYAEYHLFPESLLWEMVNTYLRAYRKSALLIDFYHTLHSQYTYTFFRNLEPCDE